MERERQPSIGEVRSLRRAAWGIVALATAFPVTQANAATSPAPRVVPDVGAVRVSWKAVEGALTYSVETGRQGNLCVTTSLSCRIPLRSADPVRFRLRTETRTSVTVSGWSYTVTPHLLVVVAGQSNALGQESYVIDPSTRINYFGSPFRTAADRTSRIVWLPWWTQRSATTAWQPLTSSQYLLSDIGRTSPIFGPEIGLARQIWTDTRTPIWIIKGAYPNTSLAVEWSPSGGLYRSLIASVTSRMQADARSGTVDVLGAVYWFQGENDALASGSAAAYGTNLNQLLDNFTRDLPFMNGPNFVIAKPSIAAWVGYRERTTWCFDCSQLRTSDAVVRQAIDNTAATRHDCTVVDTIDLDRVTLQIHLSNRAELELGSRLATASESLLGLTKR